MEDKLRRLRACMAEIQDLKQARSILEWDLRTYMPPGSIATRAEQIATLERLAHRLFVSDEVGALLEELSGVNDYWPYDSDEASLIRLTSREYQRQRKMPGELVAAIARAASQGQAAWEQARAASDFSMFKPHLANLLDLRRKQAQCLGPCDHIYDALLDEYETGMQTAAVQELFDGFRDDLIELVRTIDARAERVSDDILNRAYDVERQRAFGIQIARHLGFDFERGRQDESAHPFCTSFSTGDVRMTTRFDEHCLAAALFGTIHETGHGLYEQGVDPALERTALADGASLGMHESQSRLWENIVGRSLPFWHYFFPALRDTFPEALGDVSVERFYRAINKVRPSLIRVDADEVTYNLHVFIRFELELALLTDDLSVDDLPAAWNDKYEAYLGVRPPNDAQGVLQDVHWSEGYLGYFPTYSIGNVVSVQLMEQARRALPDLDGHFAKGEFGALLQWLRANVYRHGRKFTPAELVERVTGRAMDARPYIHYLQDKYGEIYGL